LTYNDIRGRPEDGRTDKNIRMEYMNVRVWFDCPDCGAKEATNFQDVCCPACCKECKSIERNYIKLGVQNTADEVIKQLKHHMNVYHKRISKSHIGNGAPQGKFAFTLTKSPTDELSEMDMIKAVKKVMAQKSCPVKYYAWYLEYGNEETKTHPHIHGMYETFSQGRIEKKHWVRAWNIWDEGTKQGAGFRGGYHRPVKLEENYSQYIRKGNGVHDSCLPGS